MSKRKPLTAYTLIKQLQKICDENNVDPNQVIIEYRETRDDDPVCVTHAEEDLYDSETNSILESIMLFNNPKEV